MGIYKPMLHSWVRNTHTRRIAQVRAVHKDPHTGAQAGVFALVGHPRKKEKVYWPVTAIEPVKRKPTRKKR